MESARLDHLFDHARGLAVRGLTDRAIDVLREILTEAPDHGAAHAFLAVCLADKKRLHAAAYEAEQGLLFEPMLGLSHFAVAYVRYGQKRLADAKEHLSIARELEPDDGDYAAFYGVIVEQEGDLEAARVAYEEAVRLDPEDPDHLATLGRWHLKRGDLDVADRLAREALELDPQHHEALLLMGGLFLRHGDVEAAREHAVGVLHDDAENRRALALLTEVKARESWALGAWWRYATWMESLGDVRAHMVLVVAFVVTRLAFLVCIDLELFDLATAVDWLWLAIVAYTWLGPAWFKRALDKELGRVELKDDF